MRNKLLTYSLFAFFALALSNGAVIAVFTDVLPQVGPAILLSIIPLAALMLIATWINYRVLIPRLFMQQRYLPYLAICFVMAMSIPLMGIVMEAAIRGWLQLPDRIHNYLSPWILVDSLSTAALLTVIMVAMGIVKIYRLWQKEVKNERMVGRQYSDAIRLVKRAISPSEISLQLSEINQLIAKDPAEADSSLRSLSNHLRKELYDLPKLTPTSSLSKPVAPRLIEFISAKRFTLLRDIALKILIACISVTAIFEASDNPNLTLDGLWAFIGMFLIICIITYGNKSLCKHFLNKGRIKSYIAGCAIFLLCMTLITIVVESLSYVHTIYNGAPALIYTLLATVSSFCTLLLYLGGITALILLHNWLRTVRKVEVLRAETARTEFAFLQSQINPHFLFNVINNTSILIHEAPDMAKQMLSQLQQMFEYQSLLTGKESVSLVEEIDFLRNYLLLEQSRKAPFEFEIAADMDEREIEVPTLLFIPFVENASKHSVGTRDINVCFKVEEGKLKFRCENLASASEPRCKSSGGLGIANTRRRLNLIYGEDYSLTTSRTSHMFVVQLIIPIKI